MTNTVLIKFGVIYLVLILPLFLVKVRSIRLKRLFDRTVGIIQSIIGWIIGINGKIRVGKTSFQSGLSSVCQLLIIQKIEDLLLKIKRIFVKIDFNQFDSIIAAKLIEKDFPDIELIADQMLDLYELNGDTLHFNMIGNVTVRKLFIDYIFGFYCLNIRRNFVQSKTPIYSNITHQFNMNLNTDWLSIRKAYRDKDYSILDWMVLLIDEVTDEAGAMKYLEDLKDESGAKEYRRKFGQIHQERNWIITTKQDVMDEVKKYRNLTHTHVILDQSVYTIGNYKLLYKTIEFIYFLPVKIYTLLVVYPISFGHLFRRLLRKDYLTFHEIYDIRHAKVGIIRKQENKLYYHKNFFDSIGLNVYTGYMIDKAEDIERATAERDYIKLCIPTTYCWGTYNTHLYASMQQDLLRNSNTRSEVVNPFTNNKFFDQTDSDDKENGDGNFEFN
ncbi:hypothetical protein [Acholeplasma hippikon]|uniref:Uncharacterized protein n=1 Tax=Acholeplasma hippikon TaxID=264636 RepID=A0A449BJW7_9MOLU|nr:hypothetical protein [Acholeplasma hippikon]VEU82765.1 Uncharacterised protein [Acholeplasma hippikon]